MGLLRLLPNLLACTILFLFAATAAAQSSIELEVTDAQENKLRDVVITAELEGAGVQAEAITNKKGKATLEIKEPGSYVIRFTAAGFAVREVPVDVESGLNTTATIALVDEATGRLQEAVESFNAGVAVVQNGGDEKEALAHFQKAAELNPDLTDAYRLIALIAAQSGDIAAAQPALERFLELAPDKAAEVSPAAYEVYRKTGQDAKLPETRTQLQAIGANGDAAIRVFNEGVELVRQEELVEAIAFFEEALALDAELIPGYRSLAALYFNDQEYEKAVPYIEGLLERAPTHREGMRLAFFSYLSLSRVEDAEAVGKRWYAADKKAAGEVAAQAEERFESNQTADAVIYATVLVGMAPDYPEGHYLLGRILAGSGEIAEAKTHLQHFLDMAPDHAEAAAAKQMLEGL